MEFVNSKNLLIEACKYSFSDLLKAAGENSDTSELYSLPQIHRNSRVKLLCDKAGWFWHDVKKDGCVYTSFSPLRTY